MSNVVFIWFLSSCIGRYMFIMVACLLCHVWNTNLDLYLQIAFLFMLVNYVICTRNTNTSSFLITILYIQLKVSEDLEIIFCLKGSGSDSTDIFNFI